MISIANPGPHGAGPLVPPSPGAHRPTGAEAAPGSRPRATIATAGGTRPGVALAEGHDSHQHGRGRGLAKEARQRIRVVAEPAPDRQTARR